MVATEMIVMAAEKFVTRAQIREAAVRDSHIVCIEVRQPEKIGARSIPCCVVNNTYAAISKAIRAASLPVANDVIESAVFHIGKIKTKSEIVHLDFLKRSVCDPITFECGIVCAPITTEI